MTQPGDCDALVERVTDILREHDSDRMECMDHDGRCCPAGDSHDMTAYGARRHMAARAVEVTLDRATPPGRTDA